MDRPILFNGELVRAILAGRKTQTRLVKALGIIIEELAKDIRRSFEEEPCPGRTDDQPTGTGGGVARGATESMGTDGCTGVHRGFEGKSIENDEPSHAKPCVKDGIPQGSDEMSLGDGGDADEESLGALIRDLHRRVKALEASLVASAGGDIMPSSYHASARDMTEVVVSGTRYWRDKRGWRRDIADGLSAGVPVYVEALLEALKAVAADIDKHGRHIITAKTLRMVCDAIHTAGP